MGVLSAFAVLWSAMETWSWSRRSGKSRIDIFTLAKLVANACGNLAHVFLSVVFSFSCFEYKEQKSITNSGEHPYSGGLPAILTDGVLGNTELIFRTT